MKKNWKQLKSLIQKLVSLATKKLSNSIFSQKKKITGVKWRHDQFIGDTIRNSDDVGNSLESKIETNLKM